MRHIWDTISVHQDVFILICSVSLTYHGCGVSVIAEDSSIVPVNCDDTCTCSVHVVPLLQFPFSDSIFVLVDSDMQTLVSQ